MFLYIYFHHFLYHIYTFILRVKIYKKYTIIILIMTLYECIQCKFETNIKSNYTQHLLTNKHKLNTNITSECKYCNYKTNKKSDYKRHLTTKKHLDKTNKENIKEIVKNELNIKTK